MPGFRPGGRLTFLGAQKGEPKMRPYIQRPRKLRAANLSGQPALKANDGVRQNSLRAKALRSNSWRKSVHEVWLSFGSQTAAVYSDRRRWLKGGAANIRNIQRPARAARFYPFSRWREKAGMRVVKP